MTGGGGLRCLSDPLTAASPSHFENTLSRFSRYSSDSSRSSSTKSSTPNCKSSTLLLIALSRLRRASQQLGGTPAEMEIACDLCLRFVPLSKVPLLLVFNDADDDFPAAASLLFEKRASTYLDAESQAILGHALVNRLLDFPDT